MNTVGTSNTPGSGKMLLLAALATVVVWQLPFGHKILYPFTLLATYAHEMGHGLTALLMGADFEQLVMFPNGSGFARWRGSVGRLGRALISSGGLVGPSVAGAFLLAISKKESRAPFILKGMSLFMAVSALVWARSIFSVLFILTVAAVFWFFSRGSGKGQVFVVQFVAVQLCLAVFSDLDYMFSEGAVVDGRRQLSDVAHIEQALFLPYWVWGGLVALISFLVLGLGLRQALKSGPPTKKASA